MCVNATHAISIADLCLYCVVAVLSIVHTTVRDLTLFLQAFILDFPDRNLNFLANECR